MDGTLNLIKEARKKRDDISYISFSRNFGKEAAIYAGLKSARGEYVAVMDADLQDPPELLPQMLDIIYTGVYDTIGTRRVNRIGEPPIRSFFARSFYKLINRLSDTDVVDGARDYQLMNRKVVNAIVSLEEYCRFSKGIYGWIGYKKSGWSMKTSKESPVKQNGLFGNCLFTPSMAFLHSPQNR